MEFLGSASALTANATNTVANISLTTAIVIAVIVALFAFSLRYGKDRIIALILALYLGLLAFLYFPYGEQVVGAVPIGGSDVLPQTLLFMVFVLVAYIAVYRSIMAEFPRGSVRYVQAGVLALAAAALLLAFSYIILPLASAYELDIPVEGLFENKDYFFWWLVAPLLAIFFFGRD